jgi:hypothetical protein
MFDRVVVHENKQASVVDWTNKSGGSTVMSELSSDTPS